MCIKKNEISVIFYIQNAPQCMLDVCVSVHIRCIKFRQNYCVDDVCVIDRFVMLTQLRDHASSDASTTC